MLPTTPALISRHPDLWPHVHIHAQFLECYNNLQRATVVTHHFIVRYVEQWADQAASRTNHMQAVAAPSSAPIPAPLPRTRVGNWHLPNPKDQTCSSLFGRAQRSTMRTEHEIAVLNGKTQRTNAGYVDTSSRPWGPVVIPSKSLPIPTLGASAQKTLQGGDCE